MRFVLDTTVIIKGLLRPRRKKQDGTFREQLRIYRLASGIINDISNKKVGLIVPAVAVIETAAVASRLSGSKDIGIQTAAMLTTISDIFNEISVLDEVIEIAARTTKSGFDSLFIACAQITGSTLITDDKKMHEAAVKQGVSARLLRDMK